MANKKIAIMVACGHFREFGYHRVFQRFYESFSQIGDIFIVATTNHFRDEVGQKPGVVILDKVQLLKDKNDNYIFDITKFSKANNQGLHEIRSRKYDVLFQACINEFIPDTNILALKKYIQGIGNKPFRWTYKSYVLGSKACLPDIRLPWILNLDYQIELVPDGAVINGDLLTIEAGLFLSKINISSYDCGWNISLEELRSKMNFVRCYTELEESKGNLSISDSFSIEIINDYVKKVNKKLPYRNVVTSEFLFNENIALFLADVSRLYLQIAATTYRMLHGLLRFFKF